VLTSIVVSVVKACTRFASLTVVAALILAITAGYYTSRNFIINTDINTLISPDLDWRKRDNQFEKAFDRDRTILAVVDAPTPVSEPNVPSSALNSQIGTPPSNRTTDSVRDESR